MCFSKPKAPKLPPSIIDTSEAVEEDRSTRRRRRGFLSTYSRGARGDQSRPNVAVKELTGV